MKKKNFILFISVVFLFFSNSLYSQDKHIKLGFQLGPSFSKVIINSTPIYHYIPVNKNTTGVFGGILAEIEVGNMFYIQPEINFIQKGYSYSNYGYNTQELTSNYFEISANMMAKFIKGSFSPFIFVGPGLNFLSTAKMEVIYLDPHRRISADITKLIEKTDIAVNFGGGAELAASNNIDIFIMARYSLGLMDIITENGNNTRETYYNRGMSLAAGLKFTL